MPQQTVQEAARENQPLPHCYAAAVLLVRRYYSLFNLLDYDGSKGGSEHLYSQPYTGGGGEQAANQFINQQVYNDFVNQNIVNEIMADELNNIPELSVD